VDTGRNRVMYITYKLMGFEEAEEDTVASDRNVAHGSESVSPDENKGSRCVLEYKGSNDKEYPSYLKIIFK